MWSDLLDLSNEEIIGTSGNCLDTVRPDYWFLFVLVLLISVFYPLGF